jgi:hypothetical protein
MHPPTHSSQQKKIFSTHLVSVLPKGINNIRHAQFPILHRSRLESGPPITNPKNRPPARPASYIANKRMMADAKYQNHKRGVFASCPSNLNAMLPSKTKTTNRKESLFPCRGSVYNELQCFWFVRWWRRIFSLISWFS